MNHFHIAMKQSSMGKEGWAVGDNLKKVWRKYESLKNFVSFQYMGSGTNMQWVYCVSTEADAAKHPIVSQYFNGDNWSQP